MSLKHVSRKPTKIMKHLEKMKIQISVSKRKDYRGYGHRHYKCWRALNVLGKSLAVCGVRVGDLVWYSQVWLLRKRTSSPQVTREVTDSLLCRESRRIPKDSCGRGDVCGQDGIVFLRIIGNLILLSSDIFAIDRGFHPQFEFSVSRKKAWMI